MTKVKDILTRNNAISEIFHTEELIAEKLPEIAKELKYYPDTWIDSLNKNYASFLVYLKGISKKFKDEIEVDIKK